MLLLIPQLPIQEGRCIWLYRESKQSKPTQEGYKDRPWHATVLHKQTSSLERAVQAGRHVGPSEKANKKKLRWPA